MINKRKARLRRAARARHVIKRLRQVRLTVHRTPRHIYAQVIDHEGKVLASASTIDQAIRKECANGGNVAAATIVGKQLAERAKKAGIKKVAFDRSGFKYHGRLKALAEAARKGGVEF